jgi:DNA-binding IclR family transcriptional regulator
MTNDAAPGRTVISKAAVILMTYLDREAHTLTDIATATGLPLSTAHRLVRQLAAWKILERTDDGDYRVGLPLRLIGGASCAAANLEERAVWCSRTCRSPSTRMFGSVCWATAG